SLAQQIAQLDNTAPVDFDPEDVQITGVDPESERVPIKDLSAAREHYVEVGLSAIKKYESISEPKYEGTRTSRQALMEESEGGDRCEDGDEDISVLEGLEGEDDENESSDEGKVRPSETGEDGDDGTDKEEQMAEPKVSYLPAKHQSEGMREKNDEDNTEGISAALRRKREDDRAKGKGVLRQIAIWDALLDARIRMQKGVVASNRLPLPLDVNEYQTQPQCQISLDKMLDEALSLSDELFNLQEYLLEKNDAVTITPRKRRKVDGTRPDYGGYLQEASANATTLQHITHPFLIQTLTKWSAKIQAVTPSVLLPSNRNAFSKGPPQVKSAVQLIDETFRNHDKLVSRTRIRRNKCARIGVMDLAGEDEVGEDYQLFDDTDFYQQLLRDVIDSKNAGSGADDWIEMQKQQKAKKKVDTKASKGRKIRYQVHEKLANFMVPVGVVGGWHEEQIDELFGWLLGRGEGERRKGR
ncbi:hypothetical protein AMATHDRAFT_143610, partial [Amanita thiersii Skay4041]